jgi:magnesium chelatase family protein
MLDRFDIHVEVAAVSAQDLALPPPPSEGSEAVAARVAAAREIQRVRFADLKLRTNAEAEGELLDRIATPESAGARLLSDAADAMRLTARGYHRVLRVARTIADLDGVEKVARVHIAEALSYRRPAHLL